MHARMCARATPPLQKDEFVARVTAVGETQQQMMAKQNEMAEQQSDIDARLRTVDGNVEDIRDTASTIKAHVGQLDQSMSLLGAGVERANHGIFLLCAAVAEVTRRVGMDNHKATDMLHSYVEAAPPELAAANPGLRALLGGGGGGLPQIMEVPGGVEDGQGGGASGAHSGLPAQGPQAQQRAPAARAGSVTAGDTSTALLYRRDSAASGTSSRGLGGFWGGGSAAATAATTSAAAARAQSIVNS